MDIAGVRRRLRLTIEEAKRDGAARRGRLDAAGRSYEAFLANIATPVFKIFANALVAEGLSYRLFTPAEALRIVKDRSDDYIEVALETASDPPTVVGRVRRTWGRRIVQHERAIRDDRSIEALTEEDVLQFLLTEIGPFIDR